MEDVPVVSLVHIELESTCGWCAEKQLIVTASACLPVLFACIDRVCRNECAKLLVHVTEACYELVPRFQIDLWKNNQRIVDFQEDVVQWLIG